MNILILAAGQRPTSQSDDYPLCLTEFNGTSLIQRVVERCGVLQPARMIAAFRSDEVQMYHLNRVITLLSPTATVISVPARTQGAACTALLAAGIIDSDDELLIVNGNELLDTDFQEVVNGFRVQQLDAGVVVFHSIHPRYSYVRTDENALVIEAAERKPISTYATAGFYWFAHGCDFVTAAKNLIRKDARVNNNFYICPTFNELILSQHRIGIHQVDANAYHPLKTGRQIEQFETTAESEQEG
jgi:dTDP-glucose pyrophosphorylase